MGVKLFEQFRFPLEADAPKANRTGYFTDNKTLVIVDNEGKTRTVTFTDQLGGGGGGGSFLFSDPTEPVHLGDLEYEFPHNFIGLQLFCQGLLLREGADHDYIETDTNKIKIVHPNIVAKLPSEPIQLGWNLLGYYRYLP